MGSCKPNAPCLLVVLAIATGLIAAKSPVSFASGGPAVRRTTATAVAAGKLPTCGERDPLPKGYGIRTGLSDLMKPLNSEYGVTANEDIIPTHIVMITGIVLLFLY